MTRYAKGTLADVFEREPNPRRDAARRSPRLSGVTVPRELLAAVKAEAERQGLSLSAAVQAALRGWMGL